MTSVWYRLGAGLAGLTTTASTIAIGSLTWIAYDKSMTVYDMALGWMAYGFLREWANPTK